MVRLRMISGYWQNRFTLPENRFNVSVKHRSLRNSKGSRRKEGRPPQRWFLVWRTKLARPTGTPLKIFPGCQGAGLGEHDVIRDDTIRRITEAAYDDFRI